jgi:hypothetical protein
MNRKSRMKHRNTAAWLDAELVVQRESKKNERIAASTAKLHALMAWWKLI